MATAFDTVQINNFKALHDTVIVSDMNFSEKLSHGGIVLPFSDGKLEGIHPRWGKVYAVGPTQTNISVGQYVCVKHGRWTRGHEIEDVTGKHTIRRIDPADILLVSNEPMRDETLGSHL